MRASDRDFPHRPADPVVDVLFADAALLVVNKPSGLLAVPGRGPDKADCVASRIVAIHPDALIVHRLDMATSGLMLMARGKRMQRELSRLFVERKIEKRYVAVVHGNIAGDFGEIDLPLQVDWPNRPRRQVNFVRGKPAQTRYRVLERGPASTRIALEPLTGRTHQLRVHLSAIGHPIVGDPLYGGKSNASAGERLLLHASGLVFAHPDGGALVRFDCPPPF